MPIVVNVDVMLARRKMRLNELAEQVGITPQNLSVLKTGRARAIRLQHAREAREVLECQPGDLFAFEPPSPGLRPRGGVESRRDPVCFVVAWYFSRRIRAAREGAEKQQSRAPECSGHLRSDDR